MTLAEAIISILLGLDLGLLLYSEIQWQKMRRKHRALDAEMTRQIAMLKSLTEGR